MDEEQEPLKPKKASNIEQFSNEAKRTIFEVVYMLLEEEKASFWELVVPMIIEFVQTLEFPFKGENIFPWKDKTIVPIAKLAINTMKFGNWLQKLGWKIFCAIFYFGIVMVIVVILDIIYVIYSFSKKRFTAVWPLNLLRSMCRLFVTVLFLPLIDIFCTIIDCSKQETGQWLSNNFNDLICFNGIYHVHVIFSVLLSICFILISLVVAYCCFETRTFSNDPSSKINAKLEVFNILWKMIAQYLFTFFGYDSKYAWYLCLYLLVVSMVDLYLNFVQRPYYVDTINTVKCIICAELAWTHVMLAIILILKDTSYNMSVVVWIIGIPFIFLIFLLIKTPNEKLIESSLSSASDGNQACAYIRYILYLSTCQEGSNSLEFEGYASYHIDGCGLPNCPLKKWRDLSRNKQELTTDKDMPEEHFQKQKDLYLMEFIRSLYELALERYPTNSQLLLSYALFFLERKKNKGAALKILEKAEKSNPSFDEEFAIFKYK